MCEGAGVPVLACTIELPELADLGLELHLEPFHWLRHASSLDLVHLHGLMLPRLLLLLFLDFLAARLLLLQIATAF